MALFHRVTIVGLGLIGGSLGMAIRRKRVAREVIGFSRRASTIHQAKHLGAIDVGATNPAQAVREADVVILATPVDAIVPQAKRVASFMRPGAVLTDVGSTKARIVDALERELPPSVRFVGAHPLAGSEQRGITAAKAGLFDGAVCILTPTSRTDRDAHRLVMQLWNSLTRRVVDMPPTTHDRLLAAVSHLPHLLAFCLTEATPHEALAVAPRSFLEATRVAKSDPELWDDILLSNRDALLTAMARFDRSWKQARQQLARGDRPALQRLLRHAQAIRQALPD